MKRLSKLYFIAPVTLALAVGMTGCATDQPKKQALVCPQCKMVAVTRTVEVPADDDVTFWEKEVTETQHSCPGCQGAITTFFKEGKLHHKCSICDQEAFLCTFAHKTFPSGPATK